MNQVTAVVTTIMTTCILLIEPKINPIVDEIPVGLKKNFSITNTREYIVSITNLTDDFMHFPPRVSVECFNCVKVNPAIITIRQPRGINSFELPIIMTSSEQKEVLYNRTERTLCPWNTLNSQRSYMDNFIYSNSDTNTLIVTLSTSSTTNVVVGLEVNLVMNFIMKLDENKTFTLTPTTPRIYFYNFTNDVESIVLKVISDSTDCMIMSVHNRSCPLADVFYKTKFGTVTELGAMTITRNIYPYGFYAKFSVHSNDVYCSAPLLMDGERVKTVVLSVSKSMSSSLILYMIIGTLSTIFVVCASIILWTHVCFMRTDIKVPNLEELSVITSPIVPSTSANASEGIVFRCDNTPTLSPVTDDTLSIKTDSSLDETDLDVLADLERMKDIFRTKPVLHLSDLAKKNPTVLNKKSELYFWNLMTVAIFYSLPASQLVLTYQYNLNQSGNQDLCYYNFLCSHPLGLINDFNHFFSNIGYLSLGIVFIIITKRKQDIHKILLCQNNKLDRQYGVPQHFGLFYAMGSSLMVEGVLSACYHICPNIYNFQFDASFMYIIGALCMIKIYQSRHPDVNATAYSTFFLMAFLLFLAICGVFNNTPIFWAVFNVVHLGTVFYISLKVYYVGRFVCDIPAIVRYMKECRFRRGSFYLMYPTRFYLIAAINACNWCIAISSVAIGVKDVTTHMLLIFIVNLVLYTAFYIIMKVISGEKILFQPLTYIILSGICWAAALYFFFNRTISWKKTPAESRMYNKPCVLFDFYDNHDIWHFISSAGLFFSFLSLLTLDDDLIFVHRCKIPVF